MGYRSDVAIAIYGPEDAMVALIAGQRLGDKSALNMDEKYIEQTRYTSGGEPYIMLSTYQESVKWYDGYPEVRAWSDLFSHISETCEETGIAGEFTRIGEEQDDIEVEYVGDVEFFVTTHRSVSIDLPPTKQERNAHDNANASTPG